MAMPERICRSVPVPSSRVKRSSLLDFFTAWQSFTFTARKSLLQKVSKSTLSSRHGRSAAAIGVFASRTDLFLSGQVNR